MTRLEAMAALGLPVNTDRDAAEDLIADEPNVARAVEAIEEGHAPKDAATRYGLRWVDARNCIDWTALP